MLDDAVLSRLLTAGLGSDATLRGVQRLRGGSKKGVLRLRLNRSSALLYVWATSENWWAGAREVGLADGDPFAEANGLDSFLAAHEQLTAVRVRVPDVLLVERAVDGMDVDVALVEDVPGLSLEELLAVDGPAAALVVERLGAELDRMASAHRATYGRVSGPNGSELDFATAVRHRALRQVDAAAALEPRLASVTQPLRETVRGLAEQVRPRAGYCLVHGELGPDHVRVDADGQPVLIDIEGLMWADPEWEHAFLDLRFGDHYGPLSRPALDRSRLRFYQLALSISLVEGPLRLLTTGFPDAEGMRGIAEHNLARVLAFLR